MDGETEAPPKSGYGPNLGQPESRRFAERTQLSAQDNPDNGPRQSDLQRRGARRILVPGLLDLGMTPNYSSQGPETAALATSLSKHFNQKLLAALPKGVLYFDTFGLFQAMRTHPGAFGLTNVIDQCLDPNTGAPCPNPGQCLFWDGFHPAEHVQIILGVGFALAAHGFDQSVRGAQVEP